MRNAIYLLLNLIFLMSPAPVRAAQPSYDLSQRLHQFVFAMVRGESERARGYLALDEMFRPLRDSGDVASLAAFVDNRFPEILAKHYLEQPKIDVVVLANRVHADSFGTIDILAKFYPAPALFSFSIYKQHEAWWVLNMRFINDAEKVATAVASLGVPDEAVASSLNVASLDTEITPPQPTVPDDLLVKAAESTPSNSIDLPAGAHEAPYSQSNVESISVAKGVEAYNRRDYRRAFAIWQQLARDGIRKAQFHLGAMYMEGRLDAPDQVQAYVWLRRAERAGYAQAQPLLSTLSLQMNRVQLGKARRLLIEDQQVKDRFQPSGNPITANYESG